MDFYSILCIVLIIGLIGFSLYVSWNRDNQKDAQVEKRENQERMYNQIREKVK